MTASEITKAIGGVIARNINESQRRGRALDLAVIAAGPSSPGYSAQEISGKIEEIADRFFAYAGRDLPDMNLIAQIPTTEAILEHLRKTTPSDHNGDRT